MTDKLDRFVRRQNVERYKRLLERTTDDDRRDHLASLIKAEKQKQKDANDPVHPY